MLILDKREKWVTREIIGAVCIKKEGSTCVSRPSVVLSDTEFTFLDKGRVSALSFFSRFLRVWYDYTQWFLYCFAAILPGSRLQCRLCDGGGFDCTYYICVFAIKLFRC